MKTGAWAVALLLLAGCGGEYKVDGKVDVGGEVRHTFHMDDLKTYFAYECEDKQPGDKCYQPKPDDCVNCLIGQFLSKVY